jgi:hypothetical protein
MVGGRGEMPKIDEHEAWIYCPTCDHHVGELRRQSLEELGGGEDVTAHHFHPSEDNECEKITSVKCFERNQLFERSTTK